MRDYASKNFLKKERKTQKTKEIFFTAFAITAKAMKIGAFYALILGTIFLAMAL